MRMAMIGLVLGAAWLQTAAALPSVHVIALAAVLLLAWLFALARGSRCALVTRRPWVRASLAGLTGYVAGFLWAAWMAHRALAPQLPAEDEGRDVVIVGTVDNLPYRFSQGVRFDFAVERASAGMPPRIALSWYSGYRDQVSVVPDLRPGERWQLMVRLQRPHGNANPYGFDYEVWLLEQGLRATGYVRPSDGNQRLDGFVVSFNNMVERGRAVLRERILAALPGKPYAGVIVALVVGDQRGIDQSDWAIFNRTGIGHLISISGLHITMVAGLFALGAFTLWRRSFFTNAQLPLMLPGQKVAALVGAVVALFYVLLAGFGVPAQRTLYMLMVVAAALWLNRLSSISHVLCTALGVVVLIDPWAVLWPGFWLSFGAVAIILYATAGRVAPRPPRRTPQPGAPTRAPAEDLQTSAAAALAQTGTPQPVAPTQAPAGLPQDGIGALQEADAPLAGDATLAASNGWARAGAAVRSWWLHWWLALRAGAHTQYVVTFGLVPITMLLFGQVSVVSPLANAVAIPLISLVVTPLALIGAMLPAPLAALVLAFAHLLVAWLAACLQWFSALRYAVWAAPVPPFWLFCWAMVGTIWLLAPRGWPVRWLGLAAWMPLLSAQATHPAPGHVTITAFDIGQGMALLIETSGHRLLYDTGPAYAPDSDAGSRVLLPYLRARGIAHLDGIMISHSDTDHSGGAISVMRGVPTDWMLSSLSPNHPIAQAARRYLHCAAGQRWEWDGVRFEILHPLADSYADATLKPNARTCTLKVTASGKSMLLAGDIEAAQEAQLLARGAAELHADILLAPHHGSGTSSTPAFLAAVNPQAAVFQVGYRNRYHHPKPEIYARYGQLRIQRYRTDQLGALTLELGPDIAISSYRETHARYWYGR